MTHRDKVSIAVPGRDAVFVKLGTHYPHRFAMVLRMRTLPQSTNCVYYYQILCPRCRRPTRKARLPTSGSRCRSSPKATTATCGRCSALARRRRGASAARRVTVTHSAHFRPYMCRAREALQRLPREMAAVLAAWHDERQKNKTLLCVSSCSIRSCIRYTD